MSASTPRTDARYEQLAIYLKDEPHDGLRDRRMIDGLYAHAITLERELAAKEEWVKHAIALREKAERELAAMTKRHEASHAEVMRLAERLRHVDKDFQTTMHANAQRDVSEYVDGGESVLARHSGETDRREWHNVGTWLYPGNEIVERQVKP